MTNKILKKSLLGASLAIVLQACSVPGVVQKSAHSDLPESYNVSLDTTNTADMGWQDFFSDPQLKTLIDSALVKNQELNIFRQEMAISKNEIQARKGEYLPFISLGADGGVEKVGRYTSQGANDANTEIRPGEEFPEPLPEMRAGVFASWELDVWKKLRNSKKSAVYEYLGTIEGKRFMETRLIAEIAHSYYELLTLDNQLNIIEQNLEIQKNALKIVKLQKRAARATELAVRRFEAEVLKNQRQKFTIRQKITETENRINYLTGRNPQPVKRNPEAFLNREYDSIYTGIPSQLLQNRPDIRQAELELKSAELDIEVAKANFYPSFRITAGAGFEAFNPRYLLNSPESLLYSLAGDLSAPLINRNAIKAAYKSANARQIQAAFEYEQTILNAYIEVTNTLSNIKNLKESYDLGSQQVNALTESIAISNRLFQSARADYMEVLLTQRDALEAKMDLVENKMQHMKARIDLYQALGGGWN